MKKTCVKGNTITVLLSAAGYYIGTMEMDRDLEMELPCCRVSQEYWKKMADAEAALETGNFTTRSCPENMFCSGGKGCFVPGFSDDLKSILDWEEPKEDGFGLNEMRSLPREATVEKWLPFGELHSANELKDLIQDDPFVEALLDSLELK